MRQYIQRYLKKPKLLFADRRNGVVLSRSCNPRECDFEGKNKIYAGANVFGSEIGRGTYIGPYSQLRKCKVGRYCSIGPQVMVISGKHPIDERLSSHPCFYSTKRQGGFTYVDQQSYEEFLYSDTEHRYFSEIGSDVWIGARVTILGGVRIGHGAVIATGSVVTKDVDPYSIVGGVPAKHIRHRFDEGQRKAILQDPWWDKDEVWIQANLNLFTDKGAT